MVIKCCKGCVAPKRYPGCHGHCPEYLQEKEAYEKRKAEDDKKNAVKYGITSQRTASVTKALRKKGSYYG